MVELGRAVRNLKKGDRVVMPFPVACGGCFFCKMGFRSLCDKSNSNPEIAEAAYDYSCRGLFGSLHKIGGLPSADAENCKIGPATPSPCGGCGPVGLLCIKGTFLLGAAHEIEINDVEGRIQVAREGCRAEMVNFTKVSCSANSTNALRGAGLMHRRRGHESAWDGSARHI